MEYIKKTAIESTNYLLNEFNHKKIELFSQEISKDQIIDNDFLNAELNKAQIDIEDALKKDQNSKISRLEKKIDYIKRVIGLYNLFNDEVPGVKKNANKSNIFS